jgi:hypothetical protein
MGRSPRERRGRANPPISRDDNARIGLGRH